jgi:hypothetical protein
VIADLVVFLAALETAASDRVYQRAAPQSAPYPLVIVRRVSGASGLDLNGADGHASPRFQIDIYGKGVTSLPEIQAIARAISRALHGFHGQLGATSVLCIAKDNEQDLDDFDGDEVLRRITQDFLITYLEG